MTDRKKQLPFQRARLAVLGLLRQQERQNHRHKCSLIRQWLQETRATTVAVVRLESSWHWASASSRLNLGIVPLSGNDLCLLFGSLGKHPRLPKRRQRSFRRQFLWIHFFPRLPPGNARHTRLRLGFQAEPVNHGGSQAGAWEPDKLTIKSVAVAVAVAGEQG